MGMMGGLAVGGVVTGGALEDTPAGAAGGRGGVRTGLIGGIGGMMRRRAVRRAEGRGSSWR